MNIYFYTAYFLQLEDKNRDLKRHSLTDEVSQTSSAIEGQFKTANWWDTDSKCNEYKQTSTPMYFTNEEEKNESDRDDHS